MTTIRRRRRARSSRGTLRIRVKVATLPPEDIVMVDGFRVTSPARTLIDLAGELPAEEARRLIRQAIDRGLVSLEELHRAAVMRNDLEGIERFRQVLRDLDLS